MAPTPDKDERLRLTYRLACDTERLARAAAREIALEQTVELPEGCFDRRIEEGFVGRVEQVEPAARGRFRAVISYDLEAVGGDVPQLVNLLFGNISLKTGVLLRQVDWPDALLSNLSGPRLGVGGLRDLCEVRGRPLLCAALKPMGLSSRELAEICRRFALGGIDIIKDDHGLADQRAAPFEQRVRRCQDAVSAANERTGRRTLYFPNLAGGTRKLASQLDRVRSAGCRGVLLAPMLLGLDTPRWVADASDLAILAHPSLTGAFFREDHGVAAEVLLGQIFRILGADGVIYPNVGGRFPFSEATCRAINRNLRGPLGALKPSFPVPAGGIGVREVPGWIDRYGNDTMFLLGGSLYSQPDLEEATRQLARRVASHAKGEPSPS